MMRSLVLKVTIFSLFTSVNISCAKNSKHINNSASVYSYALIGQTIVEREREKTYLDGDLDPFGPEPSIDQMYERYKSNEVMFTEEEKIDFFWTLFNYYDLQNSSHQHFLGIAHHEVGVEFKERVQTFYGKELSTKKNSYRLKYLLASLQILEGLEVAETKQRLE